MIVPAADAALAVAYSPAWKLQHLVKSTICTITEAIRIHLKR